MVEAVTPSEHGRPAKGCRGATVIPLHASGDRSPLAGGLFDYSRWQRQVGALA